MTPNNEKQEPQYVCTLTDEMIAFLKANSSVVFTETNYYFLPYWFKDIGNGRFEMLMLGNLPSELSDVLNRHRGLEEGVPDRSQESHEDAVNRYLDHPRDETYEERVERIKRFRCGY